MYPTETRDKSSNVPHVPSTPGMTSFLMPANLLTETQDIVILLIYSFIYGVELFSHN